MSVTCYTSSAMSHLAVWRNPSENATRWRQLGKVVLTELALPVLAVAALVETIAHLVLILLFRTSSAARLGSSAFTIIWALKNMAYDNLLHANIWTRESSARNQVEQMFFRVNDLVMLVPLPISLVRPSDQEEIIALAQEEMNLGFAMAGQMGLIGNDPEFQERSRAYQQRLHKSFR